MSSLEHVAARLSSGEPVSEADAREILSTPDLLAVGMLADDVRRRIHGSRTTFLRVFEIHLDAPATQFPPRVVAGEFRIVGTPVSVDHAVAATQSATALAGGITVSGFSLEDLHALAGDTASFRSLCSRLHEAGLETIAEVRLDPGTDTAGMVTEARAAGLGVSRLTVHASSADQRIAVVNRARDLQRAVGGFRVFAPLPRAIAKTMPTTGYDDVKQVALARLIATNIGCIQVDWALYGPKLAQVALTIGADDVDSVAAVDPGVLGIRRSPLEEILGNIRVAGLQPVERNGRFEVLDEARR
jgi:aminodeoxyfutalosine synthase